MLIKKLVVKERARNIVMALIGSYSNLVFYAIASEEAAYNVNSMFLIHSPFEGLEFLTYPVIAFIAIPIYFIIFVLCDIIIRKRRSRS